MERNRRGGCASGSGVVFSARRQRGRNPSDEEDRMEEISEWRLGKRPKKDIHGLSAPANSLNKRKRWVMAQDTQPFRSLEEVKAEDDNEPSAPLQVQKHVKSRAQFKEAKFFMDSAAVPRKRRSSISSSSRLTSTAKDEQDLCFTQQQSPVTTVNGSFLNRKKRLKPSGAGLHSMKVLQVSDLSAVSDQEAEVAEALFVLASSTPSRAGVLESKVEAKLGTEPKCASVSATQQRFVVVPSSSGPDFASTGLKEKRPQVDAEKKEEKSPAVGVVYSAGSPPELAHSSVGETELEFALPRPQSLAGEATSLRSETSNSKISAGSPHCVPRWPRQNKETTLRALEEQCKDCDGAKKVKQETRVNAEIEERRPEVVKRTSTGMPWNNVDSLGNRDEALTKSSRSDSVHNCEAKIDLMAPEGKNGRQHSSPLLVKEDSARGLSAGNGYLKFKDSSNKETEDQKGKTTFETSKIPRDRDVKEEDHSSKLSPNKKGNSSVSSCFSSLSSTAVSRHAPIGLAGWMNGFSHLGYDGSAATSWAATSSLSTDMKATQPPMQLPHATISSPVPKMKSCATHVYVAHYIHREQLAMRHSLWSAALCRATAYNLSIPPAKPLDNERPREAFTGFTQKDQTHQTVSSSAYNISLSSMQRMASSGSVHGSSVAGSMSASNIPTNSRASSETSTVTASGHAKTDHAEYLQTMMRQSGVATFPLLVNGRPGQADQFFSGPSHLIPHLKPLTRQASNIIPVQKQQQAKGASSSPMEQQKVLQSPFQSQQQPQILKETSASKSSAHLESESKDLSLMAPSGGWGISKFQEISSLLSGQQQHLSSQNTLSSTGHGIKGLDQSFSSAPAMIVGPGPLGLLSAASMAPIVCHEPGSHKRDQNMRTSHEATSVNDNAFILKVQQDYNEDESMTMKQGGAPFDLSDAIVEPSSWPLCGSSASPNNPLVNDEGRSLYSVSISGTQSCESESSLVREQGPFFLASHQVSSSLKAKVERYCACSSTSRAPSTPPRVHSSASAASYSALEALSVWSSPSSVSKGAPSFVSESPSDGKGILPSHSSRVEARDHQQAGQAQQCWDSDAQTLHTQQEHSQGVSSPILAANDGLHSSSLDSTSGATILETPPTSEYSKPLLDGGIQQGPPIFSSSSTS